MTLKFKEFNIGGLIIDLPLVQGGMGVRVSNSSLVSAVSNEGALGVIAAVGLGEEGDVPGTNYVERSRAALIKSIRETRKLTTKPFGVNIMCALGHYDDLVNAAQE